MHGDEEDLEAAGEEAEHEQNIAGVSERLGERLHHRLPRRAGLRQDRAGLSWRGERERQRQDEQHGGGENEQRRLPAETIDEIDREGREQKLPERTGSRSGPERDRPPLRRHQLAEGADHDGEGRARESEADDQAGGQMEHRRRIGVGHRRQAEGIEDGAHAQHRHGAVPIGHRARKRLGRPPQQHLNREREREHVAPPAEGARHRREEKCQPERGPKPSTPIRQPHTRMTAGVRQDVVCEDVVCEDVACEDTVREDAGSRTTDEEVLLSSCTVVLRPLSLRSQLRPER